MANNIGDLGFNGSGSRFNSRFGSGEPILAKQLNDLATGIQTGLSMPYLGEGPSVSFTSGGTIIANSDAGIVSSGNARKLEQFETKVEMVKVDGNWEYRLKVAKGRTTFINVASGADASPQYYSGEFLPYNLINGTYEIRRINYWPTDVDSENGEDAGSNYINSGGYLKLQKEKTYCLFLLKFGPTNIGLDFPVYDVPRLVLIEAAAGSNIQSIDGGGGLVSQVINNYQATDEDGSLNVLIEIPSVSGAINHLKATTTGYITPENFAGSLYYNIGDFCIVNPTLFAIDPLFIQSAWIYPDPPYPMEDVSAGEQHGNLAVVSAVTNYDPLTTKDMQVVAPFNNTEDKRFGIIADFSLSDFVIQSKDPNTGLPYTNQTDPARFNGTIFGTHEPYSVEELNTELKIEGGIPTETVNGKAHPEITRIISNYFNRPFSSRQNIAIIYWVPASETDPTNQNGKFEISQIRTGLIDMNDKHTIGQITRFTETGTEFDSMFKGWHSIQDKLGFPNLVENVMKPILQAMNSDTNGF
jgi:hypothetical protein